MQGLRIQGWDCFEESLCVYIPPLLEFAQMVIMLYHGYVAVPLFTELAVHCLK